MHGGRPQARGILPPILGSFFAPVTFMQGVLLDADSSEVLMVIKSWDIFASISELFCSLF